MKSGLPASIADMAEIEAVAERLREAWDLGSNPIPDLIDVLETNGIRVFMIEADAENKFDGLAACVNDMPIVVVGRHWPGDRQRFTLAHELGHLMLQGRLTDGTVLMKRRPASALLERFCFRLFPYDRSWANIATP